MTNLLLAESLTTLERKICADLAHGMANLSIVCQLPYPMALILVNDFAD